MKPFDIVKLHRMSAAVYALGVWTVIGSLAFQQYTGRSDNIPNATEQNEENLLVEVYETERSKTIIIRKKDFVPLHTRILNFFQPGSGRKDE